MKQCICITWLSLRAILRERVALSMGVLLLLTLFLLPSGLRTDGTPEGELRMHLLYSLGTSFFLLSGMTLWVSCASVSGDVANKRLQMVLTKPVSRFTVILGKWIAVVLLISSLGFLCGGFTWYRIHRIAREAEISAHEAVDPQPMDLTQEIEALYVSKISSGEIPEGYPKEAVLLRLEQLVHVESYAVSPRTTRTWAFSPARPFEPEERLTLRYDYVGTSFTDVIIPGTWALSADGAEEVIEFNVNEAPQGVYKLDVVLPPAWEEVTSITLTYTNRSTGHHKVFFRPQNGIRILRDGGSFGGNLFRAILLLSGLLGLLAAVGVGTGSVFSLPVACYTTSMLLVIKGFSGVIAGVVQEGVPPTPETSGFLHALLIFRNLIFQGILVLQGPLEMEHPLIRVAEGILITPSETLRIFLIQFVPILLLIALISTFLFSRRELGAAT